MKKSRSSIFIGLFLLISLAGCANFKKKMKALVSNQPATETAQNTRPTLPTYSANENMDYRGIPREYKRMTQAKLEEENKIGEESGSLWLDEGQSSYLFAQNNQRLVGDIINVEIEGTAKKQLGTKVNVINKLIADRAAKSVASKRAPAGADGASAPATGESAGTGATPADTKKDEKQAAFSVKEVPSRIVESFPDGSYRVRGSKDFMIGRHEYKVIVTGMVRPGDIADNKVKSDQILDSKFDIVSLRRNLKL